MAFKSFKLTDTEIHMNTLHLPRVVASVRPLKIWKLAHVWTHQYVAYQGSWGMLSSPVVDSKRTISSWLSWRQSLPLEAISSDNIGIIAKWTYWKLKQIRGKKFNKTHRERKKFNHELLFICRWLFDSFGRFKKVKK